MEIGSSFRAQALFTPTRRNENVLKETTGPNGERQIAESSLRTNQGLVDAVKERERSAKGRSYGEDGLTLPVIEPDSDPSADITIIEPRPYLPPEGPISERYPEASILPSPTIEASFEQFGEGTGEEASPEIVEVQPRNFANIEKPPVESGPESRILPSPTIEASFKEARGSSAENRSEVSNVRNEAIRAQFLQGTLSLGNARGPSLYQLNALPELGEQRTSSLTKSKVTEDEKPAFSSLHIDV